MNTNLLRVKESQCSYKLLTFRNLRTSAFNKDFRQDEEGMIMAIILHCTKI